jgi:hypothetical protein
MHGPTTLIECFTILYSAVCPSAFGCRQVARGRAHHLVRVLGPRHYVVVLSCCTMVSTPAPPAESVTWQHQIPLGSGCEIITSSFRCACTVM